MNQLPGWELLTESKAAGFKLFQCPTCKTQGLNHGFAVTGAVVYPDARQLLSLGLDGVAKVWRVESEEFLCQGGAGLSALGISRCAAKVGGCCHDAQGSFWT